LHKLSIQENIVYSIKKAYLSDSSIRVFFEQDNATYIEGVGNVYFGALLSNNEVRDGKLLFEIRYRIEDPERKISFSAMPELKDAVLGIFHSVGVSKLHNSVMNIYNIKVTHDSMINYIRELKNVESISADLLHKIMKTLVYSRDFRPETKERLKDMYSQNIIDNTMSLLKAFDQINRITTDVDERICLERIYFETITELIQHRKGQS